MIFLGLKTCNHANDSRKSVKSSFLELEIESQDFSAIFSLFSPSCYGFAISTQLLVQAFFKVSSTFGVKN